MTQDLPRPFFLLQPISLNTVRANAHWPYWQDLIHWMIHDKDKHFLLAGLNWESNPYAGLGNVTNLVDKCPSQAHVFALAQISDGVITTSNSLAHFATCQGLKTIVCANKTSTNPKFFLPKRSFKAIR